MRKWLAILGEAYGFVVSAQAPGVWMLALEGIELPRVDAAFRELLRTWKLEYGKKFPVPADVTGLIAGVDNLKLQDEAEKAWHAFLYAIDRQYHPDLGWRGPQLSERVGMAGRSAGGVNFVWNASDEQRVWAKKRFIECYLRDAELDEKAKLLPMDARTKHLIGEAAERRALK